MPSDTPFDPSESESDDADYSETDDEYDDSDDEDITIFREKTVNSLTDLLNMGGKDDEKEKKEEKEKTVDSLTDLLNEDEDEIKIENTSKENEEIKIKNKKKEEIQGDKKPLNVSFGEIKIRSSDSDIDNFLDNGEEKEDIVIRKKVKTTTDDTEGIYKIIVAEEFKESLPLNLHKIIDLWQETERFLVVSSSADVMVANNMVMTICEKYYNCEDIPDYIRNTLDFHKKKSIEDRTLFMEKLKNEILEFLMKDHLPKFLAKKNKKSRRRRKNLTRSGNADPFEDKDASLSKYNKQDGKSVLVACAPEIIIKTLTGDSKDIRHMNSFILTYSYFVSSPSEFMNLLVHRYKLLSLKLNSNDKNVVTATKISLLKVVNVIKFWIGIYKDMIKLSEDLINIIKRTANECIKPIMPSAADNLLTYLDSQLTKDSKLELEDLQFTEKPPKVRRISIKSVVSVDELCIEYINPDEFARQMALVDHNLYRQIHATELLHLNWTKKEKDTMAPNVLIMIKQFNKVGEWVINQLTFPQKDARRVKLLTRFIDIAYASYQLSNFSGAMAIFSGLKHKSVTKLKEIWNELPSLSWDKWEEIVEVLKLDDNFASLKQKIQETPPPLIPYLGMYLSNLTFKDVEPTIVDGLVNLPKLEYIANVVNQVKEGQIAPYCLQPYPLVQEFILNLPFATEESPLRIPKKVRRVTLPKMESSPSVKMQKKIHFNEAAHTSSDPDCEMVKKHKRNTSTPHVVDIINRGTTLDRRRRRLSGFLLPKDRKNKE